jgi:hypothetical protein
MRSHDKGVPTAALACKRRGIWVREAAPPTTTKHKEQRCEGRRTLIAGEAAFAVGEVRIANCLHLHGANGPLIRLAPHWRWQIRVRAAVLCGRCVQSVDGCSISGTKSGDAKAGVNLVTFPVLHERQHPYPFTQGHTACNRERFRVSRPGHRGKTGGGGHLIHPSSPPHDGAEPPRPPSRRRADTRPSPSSKSSIGDESSRP